MQGAGGVDVVLNALTSPGMVASSLALLAHGGHFVEIGKRDIWSMAAVLAQRPDVSYTHVAMDFLSDAVVNVALRRLSAGLVKGSVSPLAHTIHAMESVQAALRQLSQVNTCQRFLQRGLMQLPIELRRACLPFDSLDSAASVSSSNTLWR